MSEAEAMDYALSMLRSRLAKGWTRASIEATVYEGACGPSVAGYFMSAGKISIPSCFRHDEPGTHTFRLRDLFDSLESPQGGLFA